MSCRRKRPEDNEDVVKAIERFLEEGEDSRMSSLVLKKGRIFDSDVDLLQLLGSDIDKGKPSKVRMAVVGPNNKTISKRPDVDKKKPTKVRMAVVGPNNKTPDSPKIDKTRKRKIEPRAEEPKAKVNRKRGRPKRLRCAQIVDSEVSFGICKDIWWPETQTSRVWTQKSHKHKAKLSEATVFEDSIIVRNLRVKSEVIDLSWEEHDVTILNLKFAEECPLELPDCRCEVLVPGGIRATCTESYHLEDTTTLHVPDVRYHCVVNVDLTQEEDAPVLVSEKECAMKLIPLIYKCHQVVLASKKMEDALQEIEKCLPPQISEDTYERIHKLISKHVTFWNSEVLKILSKIHVRNLNAVRFLNFLASKLDAQHQVCIGPSGVALYLLTMLKPTGVLCEDGFAGDVFRKLDEYMQIVYLKEEYEEVFTAAQLEELRWQIDQYYVLAARQEQLMAEHYGLVFSKIRHSDASCDMDAGFPAMNREVKAELLAYRDCAVFRHEPTLSEQVICIDDD